MQILAERIPGSVVHGFLCLLHIHAEVRSSSLVATAN